MPSFLATNILSLHSSFPARPNASQNLPVSFQPAFTIAHSPTLCLVCCHRFVRGFQEKDKRKILVLPSRWGKQTSILSHSVERSFVLDLKLKLIDLNLE